eukprot:402519-Rhodomonas_salina.1
MRAECEKNATKIDEAKLKTWFLQVRKPANHPRSSLSFPFFRSGVGCPLASCRRCLHARVQVCGRACVLSGACV